MTLKDQIKVSLAKKRYNFGHLAELSGIDRGSISRILGGHRTCTARSARDLAAAARELTGLPYLSFHFLNNVSIED